MSQLSERGAEFIGRFEGWRDTPYNDVANNATIGYGHLIHHGPVTSHDTTEWGTLSKAAGIHLLQTDAAIAVAAIDHAITRDLAQHERDALVSFAFNCGCGALNGSVGKAVNGGQDPTSALEQWDHAGGKVVEGLLRRRQAEAKLYTAGDYGDGKPADQTATRQQASANDTEIPSPVPAWAWDWAEWKLGRAEYKGHAGDPALRAKTHAPATVPPWAWKFLARFH
jgi:GH24 family phage-related lysozyme (muramidase)